MKTEHILIMRFSAIGDVAMTVPVVASLAKQYPNVRITVLSKSFAKVFFENLSPNVGFMEVDFDGENKGIHGLNVLYRRLAAKHFTAIADLHDVLRTKYLRLRFNLDRYRVMHIDKHHKDRKKLTAKKNKILRQLPSSFENYADVFKKLGYPITLDFKSIYSPLGGNLRQLPPVIGEKKGFQQWIGIAPFAAHQGKIYPIDKMEKVIEMITTLHPNWRIFLFGGGRNEISIMSEWEKKYKQCICVSEYLSGLSQELILMSHLNVMVSMDSANMHLASLTGIPVISIWGATHPYTGFMGWNQNEQNIIQVSLSCRPCSIYGKKPCYINKNMECMHRITPKMIMDKIDNVIKNINN